MKKFDLVVVGGGFAGTCAAISAARAGLSVLLIEKGNALGGAAVNCLVNPFMPNVTKMKRNGKSENFMLSQGLFAEIIDELIKLNAVEVSLDAVGEHPSLFHEEYLKIVLDRIALAANVNILFHSYLIGVKKNGETIEAVTVANKSGNLEFFAEYFIDATGDADLAFLSGCPYRLGREEDGLCQPMTLCFRIANVDLEKFKESRPRINVLYKEMQAQGKIKNIRENVLLMYNLVDGVLHFNSTRIVKHNPVDAFDLTKAEIAAREQVFELFYFMKENIDGFQNADLLMTAPEIGVRESRMIDGEYLLTGDDLVNCTKFKDSIALGNYDIDIHSPEGSGTSHYYFPEGQYYTIPFRSLIPKGVNNLLVAGRCISATHEAQASIRIMPIVACIGEAAGTATGIAFKDGLNVNEIDVEKVQVQLQKQGSVF
jgi:hypothetical protein